MAPQRATGTSFIPGHQLTKEQQERKRATLKKRYADGTLKHPMLGLKLSPETIKKRAKTRRENSIGNRTKVHRNGPSYWLIMTAKGQRYEHREVMERILGRPLQRQEHVHHKDHNGLNNDPTNLELMSHGAHSREHLKGRDQTKFLNSRRKPDARWSLKYERCVICGTTKTKCVSHGKCANCYMKERRPIGSNKRSPKL